ncbi:MAG: 3-hydroxyacyl-ACP dehydratase FabZ [Eubacteriales bacterium]
MELNNQQIQKIIPHRYPFLLVDKIKELEPGVKAIGIKCVTANEMQFMGHFPGNPVMPGVLIIEAMAQVGAVISLTLPENTGKLGLFGGIKEARFRRQVVPGDVLTMEVELIKQKGPVGVLKGKATVDGVVAATAEMTCMMVDAPKE